MRSTATTGSMTSGVQSVATTKLIFFKFLSPSSLNKMSFTYDDDAKLCELVTSYPQLYDLSHKDFKDIILKDNIWKEIATSLGKKTGKCLYNILITIHYFITSLVL